MTTKSKKIAKKPIASKKTAKANDSHEHEVIKSVWVSKNAMTVGIFEVKNVRRCTWLDPKIIANGSRIFRDGEWHRTQQLALRRAEQMRQAEIGKLAEKIDRIMKLKLL